MLTDPAPRFSLMVRPSVRPGIFRHRLLAVDVHIMGYLVFTRNQREKMYRACPAPVLSKYHFGANIYPIASFLLTLTNSDAFLVSKDSTW